MNKGKSQSTKIELAKHIDNEAFGTVYRCKVESSVNIYAIFLRHRSI